MSTNAKEMGCKFIDPIIRDIRHLLPRKGSYPALKSDKLNKVVVHHAAGGDGVSGDIEETVKYLKGIAKMHMKPGHLSAGGAPEIAYAFVIGANGMIYKTGSILSARWHSGNKAVNNSSVAIMLLGNLHNHPPTEQALEALRYLVSLLCRFYPVTEVGGHRDYRATACPGQWLDLKRFSVDRDKPPTAAQLRSKIKVAKQV